MRLKAGDDRHAGERLKMRRPAQPCVHHFRRCGQARAKKNPARKSGNGKQDAPRRNRRGRVNRLIDDLDALRRFELAQGAGDFGIVETLGHGVKAVLRKLDSLFEALQFLFDRASFGNDAVNGGNFLFQCPGFSGQPHMCGICFLQPGHLRHQEIRRLVILGCHAAGGNIPEFFEISFVHRSCCLHQRLALVLEAAERAQRALHQRVIVGVARPQLAQRAPPLHDVIFYAPDDRIGADQPVAHVPQFRACRLQRHPVVGKFLFKLRKPGDIARFQRRQPVAIVLLEDRQGILRCRKPLGAFRQFLFEKSLAVGNRRAFRRQ